MDVVVPYSDEIASYDLGKQHPLKPERFTLAIGLMRAYGILAEESPAQREAHGASVARTVEPDTIARADLELVHDSAYIDTVMRASADPGHFVPQRGLGPGDTPAITGIHEASMLVCGATARAVRSVLESEATRSFSVAGGLHHAHRDRAAGFCVYNDPAVAIAMARRDWSDLRVMYVDIDAHHGDGVEEAFWNDPNVLTVSVHESGRYLFPGTGRVTDTGGPQAPGSAIDVPLPPYADDACYDIVMREVVEHAARAFAPHVIVAQCGADAHRDDPLTHLGLTLVGYRSTVRAIVSLADQLCGGRLACTGGGGYGTYSVVPRAWTLLLAELLGVQLAEELPDQWREASAYASGARAPKGLTSEKAWSQPVAPDILVQETRAVVRRVRQASPLLAD